MADDEDLRIDVARAGSILAPYPSLLAARIVYEQFDDYAMFGLDEPSVTVDLTCMDGVRKTLLLGEPAPDGNHFYVMIRGEPPIYTVPSFRLHYYMLRRTDFIDTTVTASSPEAFPYDGKITFSGEVRADFSDAVISLVAETRADLRDPRSYALSFPLTRPIDQQRVVPWLSILFDLSAGSVAVVYPDHAQLEKYGLIPPYSSVMVDGQDTGDFRLFASAPDSFGQVYLMKESIPVVYRMHKNDLPWLEAQFYDLMDRRVFFHELENMDRIEEMVISARERIYTFALDHSNPDRVSAFVEGTPAGMARFIFLCEALKEVSYEEYAPDLLPEASVPYACVTFRYLSGEPDKVVAFYPGPSRKLTVVSSDMEFRFYVNSTHMDSIVSHAEASALASRQ
jgi:hypothetical protein